MSAVLIVGPLNFGSGPPAARGLLEIAAALMLLFWMIRLSCLADPSFVWTSVTLPLLCVFAYVFVRYLFCDAKWIARQEMLMFMCYTVIFLAVVNNIQRRWQLQAMCWIIVLVATAEAVDGILRHYLGGENIVHRFFFFDPYERIGFQNGTRAGGTFFTPDHYSAYLELAFALVVGHVIVLKRAWTQRLVMGYLGAMILIGISLSKSRGGWVSLVATVVFFAFLVFKGRFLDFRTALVAFIVLAGVVYYLWAKQGLIAERLQDLVQQGEASRQKTYLAALQMAKDHPLFGVGPQMFGWYYPSYQFSENQPEYAHSEFLQVLADSGIVGAGLMAWLLVAFYWSAFQMASPKDASNTPYFSGGVARRLALAIGGAAAVFALTVHSLFDFVLHIMGVGVTFATIAALMYVGAALRRKRSETDWDSFGFDRAHKTLLLSSKQQQVVFGVLGCAFLLFMFVSLNNYLSVFKFEQAEKYAFSRTNPDTDRAIQNAESSLRFDPRNVKAANLLGDLYTEKSGGNVVRQQEFLDKAKYCYEQGSRYSAEAPAAILARVQTYIETGEIEKARRDCEKLLSFNPHYAGAHLAYGLIYIVKADYPGARRELEIAHTLGTKADDPAGDEALRYLQLIKDAPRPSQPE